MNELIFLLSADIDIQTAYGFYEAVQSGRGEVFMRQLDVAFSPLRTYPKLGAVFQEPYRRLLVHEFPYGIFYSIVGRRIIVAGVMDLRQDPKAILRRLRERSA